MEPNSAAVIRPATLRDSRSIADLYMAARADALPLVKQVHSDEETRAWVHQILGQEGLLLVAEIGLHIVGFLRLVGEDLDQLYVLPDFYRKGLGSQLLARAKEVSPQRLRLYTFQSNERARAFYEHHGFRSVDYNDGTRNEENEPDILYEWNA